MRKIKLILILQLAFFGCLFSFPIVYGRDGHSLILNGEGNIPFPYVPGEVLVKWKENVSVHAIRQIKSTIGLQARKTFHTIGVQQVRIPPAMPTEEALAILRGNPLVEYAEPNYIVRALATFPNDPPFDPGDPNYGALWGLHNTGQTGGTPDADIDAPEAWDIHRGSSGVVIAVTDTGVAYNHPDLDDGINDNMITFGPTTRSSMEFWILMMMGTAMSMTSVVGILWGRITTPQTTIFMGPMYQGPSPLSGIMPRVLPE